MNRSAAYEIPDSTPEPGNAPKSNSSTPRMDKGKSKLHKNTTAFGRDLLELSPRRSSSVVDKSAHAENDEDTTNLSHMTFLLLFIVGVITGLVNGAALLAGKTLAELQARLLNRDDDRWDFGLLYFGISMCGLCAIASLMCKGESPAVLGSGMPEMKAMLASEFTPLEYPQMVSFRIMAIKIIALVLVTGAGLSVGSAGPLVHIAACIAYILMKNIPEFGDIFDSSSLTKQIFAASAAVGLATVFNAPVGGLLFSVEVTSTFYLISNYWKSFMAATAGAVAFNIFSLYRETSVTETFFDLKRIDVPFVKWELFNFVVIGVIFGYLARYYLKLHQKVYLMVRPYTRSRPIYCMILVALITAILVFVMGLYTEDSVGVAANVADVLGSGRVSEINSYEGVSRLGGLLANFLVRGFLTIIGTNSRIPAGIFMPVFLMGGILGRFVGWVVAFAVGTHGTIHVETYALVGATAFSAGITHTISAALIAVEVTGHLELLLPCLLAAVVAAGINKFSPGLSMYDQGMMNKGLESFQLLLSETGGFHFASDVMDRRVTSVTKTCTNDDIIKLLQTSKQLVFPIVESPTSNRLVGSINRWDAFYYLKQTFTDQQLYQHIRLSLTADVMEDDDRERRLKAKQAHRQRRRQFMDTLGGFRSSRDLRRRSMMNENNNVNKQYESTWTLCWKVFCCPSDQHEGTYASSSSGGMSEDEKQSFEALAYSRKSVYTRDAPDNDDEFEAMGTPISLRKRLSGARKNSVSDLESGLSGLAASGKEFFSLTRNSSGKESKIEMTETGASAADKTDKKESGNNSPAAAPPTDTAVSPFPPSGKIRKSLSGRLSSRLSPGFSFSGSGKYSRVGSFSDVPQESPMGSFSEGVDPNGVKAALEAINPPPTGSPLMRRGSAGKIVPMSSLNLSRLTIEEEPLSSTTSLKPLSPKPSGDLENQQESPLSLQNPTILNRLNSRVSPSSISLRSNLLTPLGTSSSNSNDGQNLRFELPTQAMTALPGVKEDKEGEKSSSVPDQMALPAGKEVNNLSARSEAMNSEVDQAKTGNSTSRTLDPSMDADPKVHLASVKKAAAMFKKKSKRRFNEDNNSDAGSVASSEKSGSGWFARAAHQLMKPKKRKSLIAEEDKAAQEAERQRRLKLLLETSIDIALEPLIPINVFPFTATERTTMEHIYVLFEMVKVNCVFIVSEGRLFGMISREHLLKSLKSKMV